MGSCTVKDYVSAGPFWALGGLRARQAGRVWSDVKESRAGRILKCGSESPGTGGDLCPVARALLGEDDVEATLKKITTLAVKTIDGCDHAGVSLVQGRKISTPAASDHVPGQVDAVQYETDQGPCLDAIREHETFKIDDLAKEDRWLRFSQRAAEETGVASMLSFRLFAEGDTLGALNLYSKQRGAFDDEAVAVGSVFATHAAVALAGAQHDEQMQKALQTRDVIGQAKGVLMAQQHVTADEAFDILRRASQRMNIKLRELAERVASRTPPDEKEGAA